MSSRASARRQILKASAGARPDGTTPLIKPDRLPFLVTVQPIAGSHR